MLPLFSNNKTVLITLIKQSVQRLHPFTNFNKQSQGGGRLAGGCLFLVELWTCFPGVRERGRK